MKKILLITAGVLIALALLFSWFKQNTKKASPQTTASYVHEGLNINISYCQPAAKGRVRVGANEATTIDISSPIKINDKELKAGKYALYAYPGATTWTICFNSDWDRWGATEPDPKNDVFRTEIQANNIAPMQELFLINFDKIDSTGTAYLNLHWDKTLIKIPFSKNIQ
jgi:hypothetical protein